MNKISHDSETPAVGQQVISACALICHTFNGEVKVFLPRRASTKKFLPGVFEIPGGHIDFGEHIVAGLKREIREELEVDVQIGDPFFVFDYTNPIKGSHSVEIIYFATLIDPPDTIKLHPEDHDTSLWIGKHELQKIYTPNKRQDDPEMQAIKKAFQLLEGDMLDFAH